MKSYLSSQNKNINNSLLLVSGGVDSMSLLHFFIKSNISFEVLHINHLTRGKDNLKDYQLIKNVCDSNNIKLHYYEYNHKDGNFQAKARIFRYEIAQDIVIKNNLSNIITAHHRDDLVENILMYSEKIGYRGIQKVSTLERANVFRPLLYVYKDDLYNYALNNNVKFNEDISNQKDDYRRNYFRNQVISEFSLKDKEQIIMKEFNRIANMPLLPKELTVNYLSYYNTEEQAYILHQYLQKNEIYNIKKKFIYQVLTTVSNNGTQEYTIKEDLILKSSYGVFKIEKIKKLQITERQTLIKGINIFNGIEFKVTDPDIKCWITTRKEGDRILVNGINKKVSRLMIEYKIPKDLRDKWPIICDKDRNLLYLPKKGRNIV